MRSEEGSRGLSRNRERIFARPQILCDIGEDRASIGKRASVTSSTAHFDFVTRLTETSGLSEAALSSILLVISVVATGGAGIGLLVFAARALLEQRAGRARALASVPEGAATGGGAPGPLDDLPLYVEDVPSVRSILAEEAKRRDTDLQAAQPEPLPLSGNEANATDHEPEPETVRSGSVPIVGEEPDPRDAPTTPSAMLSTNETSALPLVTKRADIPVEEGTLESKVMDPAVASEIAESGESDKVASSSGVVMAVPAMPRAVLGGGFQYGARRG
jgi:hypothetical protein